MDNALYRIIDDQRESEAKCKTDDAYDIKAPGILISIMSRHLISTLKVDLLLPDKEEIDKKERCQRRINARTDGQEASEVFSDLAPYAEESDIKANTRTRTL